MVSRITLFGGLLALVGLVLIAYHKEAAERMVEHSRLSNPWGVKNIDRIHRIIWRVTTLVAGGACVLVGSFVILNSLR